MLLALLLMRFEAIPSLRKLCRRLERRRYAREICEFTGDRAPKHNTFSLFITRAGPDTIAALFTELRDQAFKMGIVDSEASVKVSLDSTFMKTYSRRGRKGSIGTGVQESARLTAETMSWAGEPTSSYQCQLFHSLMLLGLRT
jgi:hypothetical protein